MKPQRVLVLGATGMLGHKVAQVLAGQAGLEVHAASRRPVPEPFRGRAIHHAGLDLDGGTSALRQLLERLRPDVVVNAVGAIKQRDLAGSVDQTFLLNGTLPHAIALLNPNRDARVVHVSTDCVFRGTRGGYREDDLPDAEDLYGRSKACGELNYGAHLTLRTSIVGFEHSGHLGLLSWLLGQPAGSEIRGYKGAVFSGLPTVTLAREILRLLAAGLPISGLYHVASQPVTKYDLVVRLNAALGLGLRVEADDAVVIDRSLDDERYRRATASARPGWDELVTELAADFRAWPYEPVYRALRVSGAGGRGVS